MLSIVILSVSVFTIAVLIQFFDYLTVGFSTFQSGENTSMLIRYLRWKEAFELFLKSPILGFGKQNQYIQLLLMVNILCF